MGGGGRQNHTKDYGAPLSAIKIVKYCGAGGGGGSLGALKSYTDNGAPFIVIKIVKYCGVWGGGAMGGAKILQKIMVPPLSAIKIEQYCGARGGGDALGTLKSYTDNGAPSLSLKLLSIVGSGEGGGNVPFL